MSKKHKNKKQFDWMTFSFVAVMIALVTVGILGYFANNDSKNSSFGSGNPIEFVLEDQPMVGDENAPVTMIEFVDYNCGACQSWSQMIYPVLQQDFIDKGLVKLYVVNYPFLQYNSFTTAAAAEVIHEKYPESFMDFHNGLMKLGVDKKPLSESNIIKVAKETIENFNEKEFKELIKEDKYADLVVGDKEKGNEMKVDRTPSIFINGEFFEESFDYEGMVKLIIKNLEEVDSKDSDESTKEETEKDSNKEESKDEEKSEKDNKSTEESKEEKSKSDKESNKESNKDSKSEDKENVKETKEETNSDKE